ncbi:MAG: hypothetical protein J3K34DRAFT_430096 [Monoraphidium minutum]|nr:MAG: hypothetical protein J3K34DRAFT_430096 [Monoraphidium minutum]
MRTFLLTVGVLALANAASAAYVAANVVPTWAECPVKKPTSWDPKVFDSSFESLSTLTDFTEKLSKKCQDSLLSLANCATDNDAFANPPSEVTSLSTTDGCCLSDCSKAIKETVKLGCFDDLLKQICGNPKAEKFQTGLFNAGERCADFVTGCPGTAKANATAAAKPMAAVKNATAAAVAATKEVAADATTAVKDAAAATKDAVASVVKSGAATVAASAAVLGAAAAAALLVL